MYRDAQTLVWDAAALTSTAVSTNAIDLGAAVNSGILRDIGAGEVVGFAVTVGVAADHTTGDETYEFQIVTATANDLTTGQLVIASYVIPAANLTAGKVLFLPIPPGWGGEVSQEFVGLKYTGGGTTPTITVTAWLTLASMVQAQALYPTLINID